MKKLIIFVLIFIGCASGVDLSKTGGPPAIPPAWKPYDSTTITPSNSSRPNIYVPGSVTIGATGRFVFADQFAIGSFTAGIQEAYDYAIAKGWTNGLTIIGPSGASTIHRSVRFDSSYSLIDGGGVISLGDQTCVAVAQDAIVGASTIALSDASNIVVGYEYAVWDATGLAAYHVNHIIVDSVDTETDIISFHRVGTESSGFLYAITAADDAVLSHIHDVIYTEGDTNESYKIEGLKIDGNSSTFDGSSYNVTYENTNESGWLQNALHIHAPDKEVSYIVENCRIENMAGGGLNAHGSGCIIRDNFIKNIGSHGVDIGDNSPEILNNHIENCGYSGIFYCLNIWGTVVDSNEIIGCNYGIYGISAADDNRVPSGIDYYHIITHNHITNCQRRIIYMGSYPRGVIISTNIFRNWNLVDDNHEGIRVWYGRDVIISNNEFIDDQESGTSFHAYGVRVDGAHGGSVIISENTFQNWGGDETDDSAILCYACIENNTSIINNKIYGAYKIGIANNDGSSIIEGNTLRISVSTPASYGIGIQVYGNSANVDLLHNNILTNGDGLYLVPTDGNSDFNISYNVFNGNNKAIRTDTAYTPTNVIFMGNRALNCTEDYDFQGDYPPVYRPDIGGADFKADVEMFNLGTVTSS